MTNEARALLKQVVDYLNNEDVRVSDRMVVWNVLSALRGPDNGNDDLKEATTAVIRNALGIKPDGSGYHKSLGVRSNSDTSDHRDQRLAAKEPGSFHFTYHAREALRALGLKWEFVNEDADALATKEQP